MLAGGDDATYRALLRGGGRFVRRIEVHSGGSRIDDYGDAGVPVVGATLTARLDNRLSRQLQLTLDGRLFPWRTGDLLDPLAHELVVWAGWRGGACPQYWWPVFTGPIVSVGWEDGTAAMELTAADRSETIGADEFLAPVRSGAGALVTARIRDLITDSLPGAEFAAVDETYATVAELTWEADRSGALDDLASGAGCLWYQLPDGRFTIRRTPWAQRTLSPPVATIDSSDNSTSVRISTGRRGIYTAVQVAGEAPTGDAPVSGWAQDENPDSRTYIRGPLGRRVLKVQEDTVSQAAQAQSLARQLLRRSTAQTVTITSSSPFDPSLELGDTARIVTSGGTFDRALLSFSTALVGAPIMSATWRATGEGAGDE
jgi:hypothetical protein